MNFFFFLPSLFYFRFIGQQTTLTRSVPNLNLTYTKKQKNTATPNPNKLSCKSITLTRQQRTMEQREFPRNHTEKIEQIMRVLLCDL